MLVENPAASDDRLVPWKGTAMDRKSLGLPGSEQQLFAEPAIAKKERADGSIILRSTVKLKAYTRCVGDWLEHWARQTPQRIFLAERASKKKCVPPAASPPIGQRFARNLAKTRD